jgi:hypothetical protein
VGVQEVRWDKGGTVKGRGFFFYGKRNKNHSMGTGSFVKRVEFVSDRMSYIVLRGNWCHIIVLNMHAPSQEKSDDSKDFFMRNYNRFFIFSPVPYENSFMRF